MGTKGRREEGAAEVVMSAGGEWRVAEEGYRRRDSEAYEPRPKRIWVMACEVWERVA